MARITKIILIISLFVFQFLNINTTNADFTGERGFVVTAYYSPLPNQKHYTTGSYWGDIRLNGKGHTTASGKPVEVGLLAAPKSYPFGTKIYFKGYGVGVVEDRGGAIVKAGVRGHDHDRIDIWMGYGDEGLIRAKKWGIRTITGKIVNSSNQTTLRFGEDIMSGYEDIIVNPENKKASEVKKLQVLFEKLGLYNGKLDGKYSSIKDELIAFQIKSKVIKNKYSDAAGYYGPKTVVALLKEYGTDPLIKEETTPVLLDIGDKTKTILEFGDITLDGDNPKEENVRRVQELFSKLGLYNGKIDGKYTSIKNDIIYFQKKIGLAKSEKSWGAGHIGGKTKEGLLKYFEQEETSLAIRRKIEQETKLYKLNEQDLKKLKKVAKKIDSYARIKAKGSPIKKKKIIAELKSQLSIMSRKTSNTKAKNKLRYIKDNLSS